MNETKVKIGDRVVYKSQVMTADHAVTREWPGPSGLRRLQYHFSEIRLFVPPKRS